MATSNVTIMGSEVVITVDGQQVFPPGSNPQPPNPGPGPDPGGKLAIGSNGGIMWGTNIHPIQGGTAYASIPIDVLFQMGQDLGLKRLRLDLYDASDASQSMLASALAEAGVRPVQVLPIIIPNFAGYASEQAAYDDCKRLMQTYASNFKQVLVWELGNEFELASKIKGQGSYITDYDQTKYCKARGCYRGMIAGMKDGNSSALSCIDTSGHGHFGWTDQLWKEDVKWDITGEHFYSERGNVSIRELYLEVGKTDKLALMKKNYGGRPIWITEFNYWFAEDQACDKDAMAQYLTKTMAEYDSWAKEFNIEAVDLYELLDQPHIEGREGDFGLYTDNAPNAAGNAVKQYLAAHPSVVYSTCVAASSASASSSSRGKSRR
jgi:hypothetical protein